MLSTFSRRHFLRVWGTQVLRAWFSDAVCSLLWSLWSVQICPLLLLSNLPIIIHQLGSILVFLYLQVTLLLVVWSKQWTPTGTRSASFVKSVTKNLLTWVSLRTRIGPYVMIAMQTSKQPAWENMFVINASELFNFHKSYRLLRHIMHRLCYTIHLFILKGVLRSEKLIPCRIFSHLELINFFGSFRCKLKVLSKRVMSVWTAYPIELHSLNILTWCIVNDNLIDSPQLYHRRSPIALPRRSLPPLPLQLRHVQRRVERRCPRSQEPSRIFSKRNGQSSNRVFASSYKCANKPGFKLCRMSYTVWGVTIRWESRFAERAAGP